ncbi:MAG: phosphonate ABC transporter substrate-binding protein [Acidobacteria bacterium RIFCSPLOWO2_02_FULL_61_28]|nr:MAG: phosphonate ABC transporter substrate-binding protein [Acidobacteria bacterium RIFCSPLOWO2_02_FULL_61_28]
MGKPPILVGAVIYDPKVALIWETIKNFFEAHECPMDYVFYSNYRLQVDALLAGHIHIAWNSPLAWVDAQRRSSGHCRAIAMRDTDRDRVTHILARKESGVRQLADLRGKTVATGAIDSPQATLLPLHLLRKQGLTQGRDFTVRRFDVLVGKHGDHIGGEREALESLRKAESDACAVLDLNWATWQADGTADPNRLAVLVTTAPYDHCNFTVLDRFPPEEERRWTRALFEMRYDNPAHREMMDMEGLKAWLPGRTTGYAALTEAAAQQRFFEEEGA